MRGKSHRKGYSNEFVIPSLIMFTWTFKTKQERRKERRKKKKQGLSKFHIEVPEIKPFLFLLKIYK